MVDRAHPMAVVRSFLIGCALLLLVVGCAGARSEAPQEEEQGSSPQATASEEEARCEGTRAINVDMPVRYTTNDLPGCPKGGLLLGTDKADKLDGREGADEVRGLGGSDYLEGGAVNDVIYGGPGDDVPLRGDEGDDVYYGGDGDDVLGAFVGEDVLYGRDGDDLLTAAHSPSQLDGQRDKLYCGEGKDCYYADKNDYVDSSCEKIDPFAQGAGA